MTYHQAFRSLGSVVGVELLCTSREDLGRICALWRTVLCLDPEPGLSGSTALSFRLHSPDWTPPPRGEHVYASSGLDIWRTSPGFLLQSGSGLLAVDPKQGWAVGTLGTEFWRSPLQYQRGFFTLAVLLLLNACGCFGLHGAAVERDGVGFLVVGDSGSGKTTTTISLVGSGWRYLADDAVVLHSLSGQIEALALSRGFSCTAGTLDDFPELGAPAAQGPELHGGKRLICSEAAFPARFVAATQPRVVLFPEIAAYDLRSRVLRLRKADSMARLIRQSPGVLADRVAVAAQMELLRRLVESGESFRLILGADARRPGTLGRLIEPLVATFPGSAGLPSPAPGLPAEGRSC